MTEPNAGSGFSAIATRARPMAGGWLLTGEKGWIANASIAAVMPASLCTKPIRLRATTELTLYRAV